MKAKGSNSGLMGLPGRVDKQQPFLDTSSNWAMMGRLQHESHDGDASYNQDGTFSSSLSTVLLWEWGKRGTSGPPFEIQNSKEASERCPGGAAADALKALHKKVEITSGSAKHRDKNGTL